MIRPMKLRYFRIFQLILVAMLVFSCATQPKKGAKKKMPPKKAATTPKTPVKPKAPAAPVVGKSEDEGLRITLPAVQREFRGAWIASVANINWPSRKDLSTEQQKAEAIQLLNLLQDTNFNAVILQVRPSADALYKSEHEPWSYFLTGEISKKPNPYYDPLEFWVEETHKRGMALHVWLNPFRAHHSSGGSVTSASMVKKSPENIVRLRNGMYWFDPASAQTQDHVSKVVKDIIRRYDIDGMHFDDYFYPYATYNQGKDFPDDATWRTYQNSGGTLNRADWRRGNVNKFVQRIYTEIKAEKPQVLFGISPFGIWKPGYPAGVVGSSQYDELYADAKLWLNQGWVDYFTPQLYWPISSKGQSFPALLRWWESENVKNRHLWPGLNTVEIKAADRPAEIVSQIALSREILKNDAGEVHWSIAGLTKNPAMTAALKKGPYSEKALLPRTSWIKAENMEKPVLECTVTTGSVVANWSAASAKNVFQWVLYLKYGEAWETVVLNAADTHKTVEKSKNGKLLNMIVVRPVDRLGNEGEYVAKKLKY